MLGLKPVDERIVQLERPTQFSPEASGEIAVLLHLNQASGHFHQVCKELTQLLHDGAHGQRQRLFLFAAPEDVSLCRCAEELDGSAVTRLLIHAGAFLPPLHLVLPSFDIGKRDATSVHLLFDVGLGLFLDQGKRIRARVESLDVAVNLRLCVKHPNALAGYDNGLWRAGRLNRAELDVEIHKRSCLLLGHPSLLLRLANAIRQTLHLGRVIDCRPSLTRIKKVDKVPHPLLGGRHLGPVNVLLKRQRILLGVGLIHKLVHRVVNGIRPFWRQLNARPLVLHGRVTGHFRLQRRHSFALRLGIHLALFLILPKAMNHFVGRILRGRCQYLCRSLFGKSHRHKRTLAREVLPPKCAVRKGRVCRAYQGHWQQGNRRGWQACPVSFEILHRRRRYLGV